jgi:hypothetical protein
MRRHLVVISPPTPLSTKIVDLPVALLSPLPHLKMRKVCEK